MKFVHDERMDPNPANLDTCNDSLLYSWEYLKEAKLMISVDQILKLTVKRNKTKFTTNALGVC